MSNLSSEKQNAKQSIEQSQSFSAVANSAIEAIKLQSLQIERLTNYVDSDFVDAANAILQSSGRLIVCGMGKSGHIGRKVAATMASTGTPSFFVHPAEAFHGDLGMIQPADIVMLLSNSGETDEVLKLIPTLQHFGNKVIALTGDEQSTLAKNSDFVLKAKVDKELCPNNLAPTSSTTAALVMGDALAVSLISQRNFQPNDFAMYHPGGSLGRKLLTKVKDVMHSENLPFVSPTTPMQEVILTMTNSSLGLAIVVNDGELLGVITDGDLRRTLSDNLSLESLTAEQIMSEKPICIAAQEMLSDAEAIMKEKHIKQLLVLESTSSGNVVGVLEYFQ